MQSSIPEPVGLPKPNAVDSALPKDSSHNQATYVAVNLAEEGDESIYFFSDNGPGKQQTLSVPLRYCEVKKGVANPDAKVLPLLSADLRSKGTAGLLHVMWPGYSDIGDFKSLQLDVTIGELAKQIADIFREFFSKANNEGQKPGLGDITFDQIRLSNIHFNGFFWVMEAYYLKANGSDNNVLSTDLTEAFLPLS